MRGNGFIGPLPFHHYLGERIFYFVGPETKLFINVADAGPVVQAAARVGTVAILTELLAAGAPVGPTGPSGWTPLHWAAGIEGDLTRARVLLDAGANPGAATRAGFTPLMAAVQAGGGREAAHEAIKEHAVAAALVQRETGAEGNDLLDRLASDDRLPFDRTALDDALGSASAFVGAAPAQVASFAALVADTVAAYPEAAAYDPEPLL